jgi:GMP synthase (glutamine-hydrolysing)
MKCEQELKAFLENQIKEIKEKVGKERVLLALSGGVDSSVCAKLISQAIPGQLTCVFVDHGFMRKNEGDAVRALFADSDLELISVDAEDRFLKLIAGVDDPEQKRKLVGAEFVKVFEEEAAKLGTVAFLAQGTIISDVIESGTNEKDTLIKSHHNVGGLPESMGFTGLVEPIRSLYKDEVRLLGRMLGLPASFTERQAFPGPGLSVRVIGAVTKEKLDILRDADAIFREEIEGSGIHCSQYFAIFTGIRTTGIRDGKRGYEYVIALRAYRSEDIMTASVAPLPYDLLKRITDRIIGEVPGAGRVVYDLTDKPPGTMEWE